MGLLDNGMKLGAGLAIGIGALVLAPAIIPAAGAIARPLAKATIKGGLMFIGRTREMIAEATEVMEDLAAEAKAELLRDASPSEPAGTSQQSQGPQSAS